MEYARLLRFAQEDTSPENDYRLQHIIVYLIQNQAPKKILERTLLTQFADRNLAFDERWVKLVFKSETSLEPDAVIGVTVTCSGTKGYTLSQFLATTSRG